MFLVFLAADVMRREAVDSSVVAAVGYSEPDGTLEIEFCTGRIYHYFDVPPAEYEALLHARSVGHYFNTKIRDRYRAEEVGAG